MASYDTITLKSRGVIPGITVPYTGACASGPPAVWAAIPGKEPPASSRVFYTPSFTSTIKRDPTKGTGRSWSKIKKSGEISFTPYSVSKTTTDNFVIEKTRVTSLWSWHATTCGGVLQYNGPVEQALTTYVEKSDLQTYVSSSTGPGIGSRYRTLQSTFEEEVRDAISTTRQAAYAQAMSTYDLLSELAEAKETLGFMQATVGSAAEALRKFAYTDEPTYRRARGLSAQALLKHSDKAFRRLGSRWMEYRYAIMPLIYSIKDINELIAKRDSVYKTGHERTTISTRVDQSDVGFPSNGSLTYGAGTLDATVHSIFKARYNRGALQRVLSQTSFNPFKTGWERLPYSFVADWFFNVGDAITAATTIDLSSQSVGCTAIKRKIVYEVRHFDNVPDVSTQTIAAFAGVPQRTFTFTNPRNMDELLQRVVTESYDRTVFNFPQPAIHFDPFLNWKRALDGLVLSYQPIKKLLRSL